MNDLGARLTAAANGDDSWRGQLFREAAAALAQGTSPGTAKTPKAVEGRSPAGPVAEGHAPETPRHD